MKEAPIACLFIHEKGESLCVINTRQHFRIKYPVIRAMLLDQVHLPNTLLFLNALKMLLSYENIDFQNTHKNEYETSHCSLSEMEYNKSRDEFTCTCRESDSIAIKGSDILLQI